MIQEAAKIPAAPFWEAVRVLSRVIRVIGADPRRPTFWSTLPALLLALISRFLGAFALLLLPVAIFGPDVVSSGVLDRVEARIPYKMTLEMIWLTAVVLAPLCYFAHAFGAYLASKRLLAFSISYQKALSGRVGRAFAARVEGDGSDAWLAAGDARRLIVGEARYLARVYHSLILAVPDLIVGIVAAIVLIVVLPLPMILFIVLLLMMVPWQAMIASRGIAYSTAFLAGARSYSTYLAQLFVAKERLVYIDSVSRDQIEDMTLAGASGPFFDSFEQRSRIGLVNSLATQISVVLMIIALIGISTLPNIRSVLLDMGTGVLLLVAARHLFSGIGGAMRAVVSVGSTLPYYKGYLSLFGKPLMRGIEPTGQVDMPPAYDHAALHPRAQTQFTMPKNVQHVGFIVESKTVVWQALETLLHAQALPGFSPHIELVLPVRPVTANGVESLMESIKDIDGALLRSLYPRASPVWERLDDIVTDSIQKRVRLLTAFAFPTEEPMLIGLGRTLSRSPTGIIVSEQDLRTLTESTRKILFNALRNRTGVIVLHDGADAFCIPRPERLIYAAEELSDEVSAAKPVAHGHASTGGPDADAEPSQSVSIETLSGTRTIEDTHLVTVVAHTARLTWAEVRHFLRFAEGVSLFSGRRPALVSSGIFDTRIGVELLQPSLAALNIDRLRLVYSEIADQLLLCRPLIDAFSEPGDAGFDAIQGAAPANRLWLTIAVALSGVADLIFISEQDFRLLPQHQRQRLIKAVKDCRFVIWRNSMSEPAILPRSTYQILVANSGIIDVVPGDALVNNLSAPAHSMLTAQPFAGPKVAFGTPTEEFEE